MKNVNRVLAASALMLVLAACSSSQTANKGNFGKAIQKYLDTKNGLCAALPARELPFRLANDGSLGKRARLQANALVEAGLLSRQASEMKSMFGTSTVPAGEYALTSKGKKFLVEGGAETIAGQAAFCTGKFRVTEVDTFTEPSEMMGVKLSQVNFRYKVEDADSWARSKEVQASYRNLADQAKDEIDGKATLVLTNDGWMHERLFKR